MDYNIDLHRIPISKYMATLKNQNLLPGRRILLENLDFNFEKIMSAGIRNLFELKNSIYNPQKLAAFAAATGIPETYLVILKREIGSLEQKPVLISEFPDIAVETVSKLEEKRLKTSKNIYDFFQHSSNIAVMCEETDIGIAELQELISLCNLVRINGVGAVAARTMYKGGYRSIAEIAQANPAELLERITAVNANKQYYKANLGEKDMQFAIDAAKIILDAEKNK